jgi:hypothetical protein
MMLLKKLLCSRYCFPAPATLSFPQDSSPDRIAWFNPRVDLTVFESVTEPSIKHLLILLEAPHRILSHTSFMCQMRFVAGVIYCYLWGLGQPVPIVCEEDPIGYILAFDQTIGFFHSRAAPIFEIHALYSAKLILDKEKKRGKYLDLPSSDQVVQKSLSNLEKEFGYLFPPIKAIYNSFERSAKKVGSHFNMLPLLSLKIPFVYWSTKDNLKDRSLPDGDFKRILFNDCASVAEEYSPLIWDPWYRFTTLVEWINNHPDCGMFRLTFEDFGKELLTGCGLPFVDCSIKNGAFCLCKSINSCLKHDDFSLNMFRWPSRWLAENTLSSYKDFNQAAQRLTNQAYYNEAELVRDTDELGMSQIIFFGGSPVWKHGRILQTQCFLLLLDSLYQQILNKEGIYCPWEGVGCQGCTYDICERFGIKRYLENFFENVKKYDWATDFRAPFCLKKK